MQQIGGHIELFVTDVRKSYNFYREILGCTLVSDQDSVVWLMFGSIEILLRPGKPPVSERYSSAAFGLVLYTDNLSESKKLLENKGVVFKGTDGSDKCLTFTDPDGHWFQLVNPNDH